MDHPWLNLPALDKTKAVVPFSSPRNLLRTNLGAAKLASASTGPAPLLHWCSTGWRRLRILWSSLQARARRIRRSLVVSETASLGDRRIVSVVQFERQRFLIGGGPSSVTLLARLPDAGANEEPTARAEGTVPGAGGGQ
ncbi:MAG: flagellar biosynthetic protein FliO [Terriglobales bacterium]|jgi:hypothetical protein